MISIILTTYNRANYIKQAISSILSQTYKDWELIVIDDASIDNTTEVLEQYSDPRIRIFKNNVNLGVSKTRNRALRYSSYKYIAVLDSDDLWLDNDKLQKQLDFLIKNPEYVLVGTNAIKIDKDGKEIGKIRNKTTDRSIKRKLLIQNQFIHSSVLFKKNDLYDQEFNIGEDYDMWFRLGKEGKVANLKEFMTGYRIHEGNICRADLVKTYNSDLRIIKKYKNNYPNYYFAVVKRWVSLIINIFK